MMLKDRTKQLYADALRSLLGNRSFEDVRVADLCRLSGTNRATFYYHFRDKYDLCAWIYTQTMEEAFRDDGRWISVEQAAASMSRMQEEGDFYRKIFAHKSQNALWEYIADYNMHLFENICLQQNGAPPDEPLAFAIRYHCYACIGLTVEWLMKRRPMSAGELAARMIGRMPADLRAVVCHVDETGL